MVAFKDPAERHGSDKVSIAALARRIKYGTYEDSTFFPDPSVNQGSMAYDLSTDVVYVSDGTSWIPFVFSGSGVNTGLTTIDFGATGDHEATATITGQALLAADSMIHAWVDGTTAENDEWGHAIASMTVGFSIVDVIAGTGFTIRAVNGHGALTGEMSVRWEWA